MLSLNNKIGWARRDVTYWVLKTDAKIDGCNTILGLPDANLSVLHLVKTFLGLVWGSSNCLIKVAVANVTVLSQKLSWLDMDRSRLLLHAAEKEPLK